MILTPEMILAMGGEKSVYYKDFKNLCVEIYNCLRRHVNVFYHLLLLFNKTEQIIDYKYTEEYIRNQVIQRFNPGENYQESKFQFIVTMQKNSSNNTNSFAAKVSDNLHYYKNILSNYI